MKRSNFIYCDCCDCDVAMPHNAADCADKWKRECMIARTAYSNAMKRVAKLEEQRRADFAKAAMQGLCAFHGCEGFTPHDLAHDARLFANALIAELDEDDESCFTGDTPLAAIEAASKQEVKA